MKVRRLDRDCQCGEKAPHWEILYALLRHQQQCPRATIGGAVDTVMRVILGPDAEAQPEEMAK